MSDFEHWSKFKPLNEREEYLIGIIEKLDNELMQYRNYRKPGQKSFNNKDIVVQIFEKYFNGGSLSNIAEYLNSSGIKTKKDGGKWYKSTIKFILQNHEYVDNNYITEEVFDQVQDKLKSNRLKKEKEG